jgi:hypothetical protein
MIEIWGMLLTPERAEQIRAWRAEEDGTWRVVASKAADTWGARTGAWNNQLFGMDLCTAAAGMLGEDPNREPWN